MELHGTHGLMQAWSPKPSTAPVAGVDTGGFADMMRLSERSWSVEAGFGPRPTNRPQAREYDHRLAEARMAFEGFAPDPTIVSGLDELVLAARSTPDLTMDAHARRGFVESSRPRIVELARLATESLLCAFEPARDPYLRVQSVFRTLCEWRYGYEGDQILPSHSPDTLVIGAFLRTVAESLSAVYLADESAQKSTRDDLQAMMRLSQEATALKLSRDSVRRESPI